MVVVLIIAILIAIAIPTFLGAHPGPGSGRPVQSPQRADGGEVLLHRRPGRDGDLTDLTAIEPSLRYNADAAPATNNEIYISVGGATVTLAAAKRARHLLYIKDAAVGTGPGTFDGRSTAAPCPAPSAHAGSVTGTAW